MARATLFTVNPFDPHVVSASEWAAFHRMRALLAADTAPGEPMPSNADFEHDARRERPLFETRRFVAWAGDEAVGVLGIAFRRQGTPNYADHAPFCYVWGGVVPAWRRRGVARALLRPLLVFLRDRDKTTVTIDTQLPSGHAFLTAIGAVEKHRMVQNRLPFARLDWVELARWEAATPPELIWEVHAGAVPLNRLAALLPRFTALFRDVPMGSLDIPTVRYELPGYEAYYAENREHGGDHLLVLLLAGDEVAGMTEASWDARYPDRVNQWLTAVAPAWRGRGLAKAVKARMLRLVRERRPEVTMMTTENAEMNAPILAINAWLGFAEHRRKGTYQLSRATLEAGLR
jgi:GNAT superfamily N-acetyltransferase